MLRSLVTIKCPRFDWQVTLHLEIFLDFSQLKWKCQSRCFSAAKPRWQLLLFSGLLEARKAALRYTLGRSPHPWSPWLRTDAVTNALAQVFSIRSACFAPPACYLIVYQSLPSASPTQGLTHIWYSWLLRGWINIRKNSDAECMTKVKKHQEVQSQGLAKSQIPGPLSWKSWQQAF